MSRMTREDWMVYGILRSLRGKDYAEKYRHKRNKRNAEFGIGLPKPETGWAMVKDYGIDGMLVKKFIPGAMDEEAKADFEEANQIECPPSAYDCTGKPFTGWMSFFDVPGGVWAYHRICVDV